MNCKMYSLVQGDALHSHSHVKWQCEDTEVICSVQEGILSTTKKGERMVRLILCSYSVESS